ncbi:response regulator transcription factor [Blautia obeum]|uniref:Stage 0 sporulation protein A homolog n=1 Tax=Blautia obeum TaxID=40520 RepID=A0A174SCN0_9FIRM|nr:response regulator [Blautia obeum]CUP93488.1 Transcriptional regulatory protein BasR [Blautia obeum]
MEQLLIVEDDIGLNQGLCKALKVDDRKIISCKDLKTAKEQLLCGGVSLILLDINLPDGSGLELLREVKETIPGIPVILLTANDTDLDIVDGLERGADDYITKPFSLSVLRARVNMSWANKESANGSSYMMKWAYCTQQCKTTT